MGAGACPGSSELRAAAARAGEAVALAETEAHVAACPACSALFSTLSPQPRAEGTPPPGGYGRFVLEGRLGAGGMGVVYTAHDPQLGRRVAIKVLRSAASAGARARLAREAQAMGRLAHPNVVTVYEVGAVGEQVFVAMELVDGVTAADWVAGGARGWREIVAVYLQAGRGLAAAHSAGIVHRDFKPSNIMVGRDGRVRVLDFGLARDAGDATPEPAGGPAAPASDDLTRQGAIVGTLAYMAPEQRRGERVTQKADQWSFCVATREALSGAAPPRVLRVLERGLRADPAERFGSMHALLGALERAVRRPRAALLAGVAVAAGIVAAAATYMLPARCAPASGRLAALQLSPRLEEYGATWARASDGVCAAGESPPARRACLEDRFEALRAVSAAPSANAVFLDDASCQDPSDLVRPHPPAGALADRVRLLRARLARAEEVVDEARALGYPPALAEALLGRGWALLARGEAAQAIPLFAEARDLAEDSRYDEARARAWWGLASASAALDRIDAARRAIATARAILRPMPGARARGLAADLAVVEAALPPGK